MDTEGLSFDNTAAELIHNLLKSFPVNSEIAVAIIRAGEPEFYGARKSETDIHTIENANSLYEVGSVTKVFNGTVLANLVQQGDLSLDTGIAEILGFPLNTEHSITLKQLATHTAGLSRLPPDMFWEAMFNPSKPDPYKDYSKSDLWDYLQHKMKLKTQGKMRYSNLGAGVLASVLSEFTQLDYEQMLQQYVFGPYHMSNTYTDWKLAGDKLVSGCDKAGNTCSNWNLDALAGAGSVVSSVSDLTQFALANFDDSQAVLEFQRQCQLQGGALSTMALGWIIVDSKRHGLERFFFHNGGTGGYSSAVLLDAKEHNGVIILSNISGMHKLKGNKITNLVFTLMKQIVKQK